MGAKVSIGSVCVATALFVCNGVPAAAESRSARNYASYRDTKSVSKLSARVEAVERWVGSSKQNQSALWGAVDTLKSNLKQQKAIATEIDMIRKELATVVEEPEVTPTPIYTDEQRAELERLRSELSAATAGLDKLEGAIASGAVTADLVQAAVATLETRAAVTRDRIAAIDAAAIEASTPPDLSALIAENRHAIEQMRDAVARTEQSVTRAAPEPQEKAAEPAAAQSQELLGVQISAFGDVVVGYDGVQGDVGVGQAEVGLAKTFFGRVTVEAALAFDGESETFGLGALVIDVGLLGSEKEHLFHVSAIDHAGVVAGQFDVPFGIDLELYPSIERKLVTTPLVVDSTHAGWNAAGGQVYLEAGGFNGVAYVTKGFAYQRDTGADEPELTEMAVASGLRAGFRFVPSFEVGVSAAGFLDHHMQADMSMLGGDLQLDLDRFHAEAEIIVHSKGWAHGNPAHDAGFYVRGTYEFSRFFVVSRFGMFFPDGAEREQRLSVGAGWFVLDEHIQLRAEYQTGFAADSNAGFVQIAAGI